MKRKESSNVADSFKHPVRNERNSLSNLGSSVPGKRELCGKHRKKQQLKLFEIKHNLMDNMIPLFKLVCNMCIKISKHIIFFFCVAFFSSHLIAFWASKCKHMPIWHWSMNRLIFAEVAKLNFPRLFAELVICCFDCVDYDGLDH